MDLAFRLRLLKEDTVYALLVGENMVGRAKGCRVKLADTTVSSRHARLDVAGGAVSLADLGSKNGTLVNGRKASVTPLQPGDIIQFGAVAMQLEEAGPGEDMVAAAPVDRTGLESRSEAGIKSTKTRREATVPARWLEVTEVFSRPFSGPEEAASALRRLIHYSGAAGAAFLEGKTPAGWTVRALAGGGFPADLGNLLQTVVASTRGDAYSMLMDETAPLAFAARQHESGWLALVVAGDFPHRAGSLRLLEILLQMIAGGAGGNHLTSIGEDTRLVPAALSFPPGVVSGCSKAMKSLWKELQSLLPGNRPVLLTGETGTGKEVIARVFHASSARHDQPFIAVNCAAIPRDLFEDELFGHTKGAFTGAVSSRPGRFELAHQGMLFLDEISELPLEVQAKLNRAIQEMEIWPLGARRPLRLDVRVICATNRDLKEAVRHGYFREDLYFRICALHIHVPPLRERREDIPELAQNALWKVVKESRKAVAGLTLSALSLLQAQPWPDNVRGLENALLALSYRCQDGQPITGVMVESLLGAGGHIGSKSGELGSGRLQSAVSDVERRQIEAALDECGWNRTEAAQKLGMSRNTLLARIKRFSLRQRD